LLCPGVVTLNAFPRLCLGVLLSATGGVLPTGCSYLFVTAPPEHHEKLYDFDCTTGNVLPVVDSVVATVYGIATVSAIADKEQTGNIVGAAAAAAVFGTSALLGFGRTKDCRDARGKLAVRLEGLRGRASGASMDAPRFVADPWLDPPPAATPSTAASPPSDAWSPPQRRSDPDAAVAPVGGAPVVPSPPPAVVPAAPSSDRSDRSTPHPKED